MLVITGSGAYFIHIRVICMYQIWLFSIADVNYSGVLNELILILQQLYVLGREWDRSKQAESGSQSFQTAPLNSSLMYTHQTAVM